MLEPNPYLNPLIISGKSSINHPIENIALIIRTAKYYVTNYEHKGRIHKNGGSFLLFS